MPSFQYLKASNSAGVRQSSIMKYIYYPEYELEYRNLINNKRNIDHVLNIKLLMFLGDHIILPPSHLMRTDSANILKLINNLQEFFDAGMIVTTKYDGGLDQYFDSRIEREQSPVVRQQMIIRAKQIKSDLFFNSTVEHNRSSETEQLIFFDTRTKELLRISNHYKNQSMLLLNKIDDFSNQTGEPLHSIQFENILHELYTSGEISKRHSDYFKALMSNAYYYSGTYTMKTLVSYNSYFETINLQNSLISTNDRATNLIVNPYFLMKLFEVIGVTAEDIRKLSVKDYQEITSHKYWNSFMSIFETLYTDAYELESLLQSRTTLAAIYAKRKKTIEKILGFCIDNFFSSLTTIVSYPLSLGHSLALGFIISILTTALSSQLRINELYLQPTSEKIIDLISLRHDPLLEFSYRIRCVLENLETNS